MNLSSLKITSHDDIHSQKIIQNPILMIYSQIQNIFYAKQISYF